MVEETEITQKKEDIKEDETPEKRNTERTLKIFGVIIGIFSFFALIYLKLQNPQFPLVWVFIIAGVIIVVSLMLFFSFSILRRFQGIKDETNYTGKLPKPISLGELRKMADEALTNDMYCNHCTECLNEKFYHVGKNNSRIYVYKTKALYMTDDMKDGIVYVLINTHYPNDLRSILIEPTATELTKAIIHLSTSQDEEPDVEESLSYNPIIGAYEQKRKVSKIRDEHKKDDKKEDLE